MKQCENCGYIYSAETYEGAAADYARYWIHKENLFLNWCNNCSNVIIYKPGFFGKMKAKHILKVEEVIFSEIGAMKDRNGGFISQHFLRLIWDCLLIQQPNSNHNEIPEDAYKTAINKLSGAVVGWMMCMLLHYFQLGGVRYWEFYNPETITKWIENSQSNPKTKQIDEIFKPYAAKVYK